MNWALLIRTFAAIFLAELGDKTQIATFCSAASAGSFWPVFLGSSLALVTASLVACLLGTSLTRIVPVRWLQLAAGVVFIGLGLLLIIRNIRS
ncbi:MAG: TMEM165/GDT1 family protein [candidate division WOR-3 bacterium]